MPDRKEYVGIFFNWKGKKGNEYALFIKVILWNYFYVISKNTNGV